MKKNENDVYENTIYLSLSLSLSLNINLHHLISWWIYTIFMKTLHVLHNGTISISLFFSFSLSKYTSKWLNKHIIDFYKIICVLQTSVERFKIEVNARCVCVKEGVAVLLKFKLSIPILSRSTTTTAIVIFSVFE